MPAFRRTRNERVHFAKAEPGGIVKAAAAGKRADRLGVFNLIFILYPAPSVFEST
jgi:hypothetical protein